MTIAYAAVEIVFLDRKTNVKVATCYPVTCVTLRERDDPSQERVFVALKDGTWIEAEDVQSTDPD